MPDQYDNNQRTGFDESKCRKRSSQGWPLAKKNPCGKAWADLPFTGMKRTCFLPTKIARSLQQRYCVLFTKFPDHLWGRFPSPSHGFVLMRIIKNCGFDGRGICFETQQAMASACCLSVRVLRDVIVDLEKRGFINVNRQLKKTNRITLTAKTLSNMENFDVTGGICRQKR